MDPKAELIKVVEALRRGGLSEAEANCRNVLAEFPQHFGALALLGDVLMRTKRRDEALAAYEAALKVRPDYTPLFTATALIGFRRVFGPPPTPRQSAPGIPRIQSLAFK
jgi:predicted Zn-dependent protease